MSDLKIYSLLLAGEEDIYLWMGYANNKNEAVRLAKEKAIAELEEKINDIKKNIQRWELQVYSNTIDTSLLINKLEKDEKIKIVEKKTKIKKQTKKEKIKEERNKLLKEIIKTKSKKLFKKNAHKFNKAEIKFMCDELNIKNYEKK